MLTDREDYIMRLIRQLAEFTARLAGLRVERRFEEMDREIERGWDELDLPPLLVTRVDLATLVSMLGRHPVKLRFAAMLLAEHANVLQARRDPVHATLHRMRAIELLACARTLSTDSPRDAESDTGALAALGALIAPIELAIAMENARTVTESAAGD